MRGWEMRGGDWIYEYRRGEERRREEGMYVVCMHACMCMYVSTFCGSDLSVVVGFCSGPLGLVVNWFSDLLGLVIQWY